MERLTMVEAINLGLREEMKRDPNVIVLGEDVGVDGGVFRVTKGLLSEFGPERVVDTPLAESGIVGASIGLAICGKRPVCEIQFSGFMYQAYHQLQSHAARMRSRTWGAQTVPMVLRSPYGAGIRALEHHSESTEMIYAHIPGLVVVIPSGPRKARSLIKASIRSNDPVIFLEPSSIYRAFREDISVDEEDLYPIGHAEIVRAGSQFTIITYGAMLSLVKKTIEKGMAQKGWDPEVIDLLTISPMDTETIIQSVKKTGRVVIAHEAHRTGGVAAEISARIQEFAFLSLQAPIERVTGWDTPVPYFSRENAYVPDAFLIERAIENVLHF
ncbi:MAG: alpha-ketoacid dehydrogenase subunit beta [Deltaproteobacteria bacterium]|nr:alpha-ketoacid dehydrogenase subunit beta [Deltaproteobacteria bacterium]